MPNHIFLAVFNDLNIYRPATYNVKPSFELLLQRCSSSRTNVPARNSYDTKAIRFLWTTQPSYMPTFEDEAIWILDSARDSYIKR